MNGAEPLHRRVGRWLTLALLAAWVLTAPVAVFAEPDAVPGAPDVTGAAAAPAELVLANRTIVTLRATNSLGSTPAERAHSIERTFAELAARGGPLALSTRELPEGRAILVDGQPFFRILHGDADPESGETTQSVATEALHNLQRAVDDTREMRDSEAMLGAAGRAFGATLLLAALLWLLVRVIGWSSRRIHDVIERRAATFTPAWSHEVIGPGSIADVLTMPLKVIGWAIALLLLYQWTAFVLEFFPYTRPWGEALFANLVDALGGFGRKILEAVPGLLFVVLIFFVTRFVVRLVRAFFARVQAGRVHVGWIDEATARPTGQLLITGIWILGFVAAYPYIPGSDSEAFKGIGVFVGLMASIGASGIVNQAVSGLMLMYTRSLRPGEFVKIGDVEGTVRSVGFLTSRIETLRNVEVSVPNAFVTANVTQNYSRLAAERGMWLPTAVTIGYDTPWRQVQAMLMLAAERTADVAKDPPPRVLQTALQDFYVEYTLVVSTPDPRRKLGVLNELHAHIQDVFNEHGVQIMSPHYRGDPAQAKIVPQEHWYEPPATRATTAAAATRDDVVSGDA